MTRRVPGKNVTYVTSSEVKAAQMMVRRMSARGEQPSWSILKIANAKRASVPTDPPEQAAG